MSTPEPPSATGAASAWWRRPGFDVVDGRLSLNGADLEALAREHGTPLFVYDLARPRENMRALQEALTRAGVPYVTRFALKASRIRGSSPSCARLVRRGHATAWGSTPARRAR